MICELGSSVLLVQGLASSPGRRSKGGRISVSKFWSSDAGCSRHALLLSCRGAMLTFVDAIVHKGAVHGLELDRGDPKHGTKGKPNGDSVESGTATPLQSSGAES